MYKAISLCLGLAVKPLELYWGYFVDALWWIKWLLRNIVAVLKGIPCLRKAGETDITLAKQSLDRHLQGKQIPSMRKRLSRCTSGRWMEFGLPMGEMLKETPRRFEHHNPFGKRMITGKATGRWTSASDFQSYCPLKNVGSPQLNIQCKETSRARFLYPECSWADVRIHHTPTVCAYLAIYVSK